ncbi:MAG: helix-turn-helix transcriptional regulator [Sporomusaceae bacterium]|nr:helix-turn-helix transcriptional regulator [Sporomusaceae bacterium]
MVKYTDNDREGADEMENLVKLNWFYSPGSDTLTEEQLNLIRLLAHGVSDEQIARYLDVPVVGVEMHLERIFKKLDVTNRTQVLAKAAKCGII